VQEKGPGEERAQRGRPGSQGAGHVPEKPIVDRGVIEVRHGALRKKVSQTAMGVDTRGLHQAMRFGPAGLTSAGILYGNCMLPTPPKPP